MKEGLNLAPKILGYQFSKAIGWPKMLPINLTFSVTNMCNSRCRTCFIWKLYQNKPDLKEKEFSTSEFEKVFESIGKSIFWATMTGGEPFLRPDLTEICSALIEYCSPRIINIPTNSLSPRVIEDRTREILESCGHMDLIINLSLDGVEDAHDEIRNIPGGFELWTQTYERLSSLKSEFSNLHIGIHSVVSKYNVSSLLDFYDFARKLGADSFITEVAESRAELFNVNENIAPDLDTYTRSINELSRHMLAELKGGNSISKATQAFRLVYYRIAIKELRENRQVVPCYASFASCQINPYGDVWPCCTLGYDKPMGSLRENEYNFRDVWFSKQADEVRRYVKSKRCFCPLANAHYTNMLLDPKTLLMVLRNVIWA